MGTNREQRLRPLRVYRDGGNSRRDDLLSPVPERVPEYVMAPNRDNPTQDNGIAVPRGELHIILLAHNEKEAALLKNVVVIKPPLWKGRIHTHIVISNANEGQMAIRQTIVDLGWATSDDMEIGPPNSISEGYPRA